MSSGAWGMPKTSTGTQGILPRRRSGDFLTPWRWGLHFGFGFGTAQHNAMDFHEVSGGVEP